MLTEEDNAEIHALARRGWSVSAIARHTGRDRKTVAKYLAGKGPKRERALSCLSRIARTWPSARVRVRSRKVVSSNAALVLFPCVM